MPGQRKSSDILAEQPELSFQLAQHIVNRVHFICIENCTRKKVHRGIVGFTSVGAIATLFVAVSSAQRQLAQRQSGKEFGAQELAQTD